MSPNAPVEAQSVVEDALPRALLLDVLALTVIVVAVICIGLVGDAAYRNPLVAVCALASGAGASVIPWAADRMWRRWR